VGILRAITFIYLATFLAPLTHAIDKEMGIVQFCLLKHQVSMTAFEKKGDLGVATVALKPTQKLPQAAIFGCLKAILPSNQHVVFFNGKLLIKLLIKTEEKLFLNIERTALKSGRLEALGFCADNKKSIRIFTNRGQFVTKCKKNRWYFLSPVRKKTFTFIVAQVRKFGHKYAIDFRNL
jgi:hypothetical protein